MQIKSVTHQFIRHPRYEGDAQAHVRPLAGSAHLVMGALIISRVNPSPLGENGCPTQAPTTTTPGEPLSGVAIIRL